MPFTNREQARAAALKALEARRKNKEAKKAMSQGIGESRVFAQEGDRDPYGHLRGLHIGGRPIEEVIPPENVHLISFDHTDEGIAARNAGRSEHRVSVTADTFDRQLERMAEREPWEGGDVVGEMKQLYVREGFRARFLSPRVIDRSGTRGWQIIRQNGDPVKLGPLILAEMPEEKATKRNEYFRSQGEAEFQKVTEEFVEQGRRLEREAGSMGIRAADPGTVLRDARTHRSVVTGFSSYRGNTKNEE